MRIAIAAATVVLCLGLSGCNDQGGGAGVNSAQAGTQPCKCSPGKAPLKSQTADEESGGAIGAGGSHRGWRGHAAHPHRKTGSSRRWAAHRWATHRWAAHRWVEHRPGAERWAAISHHWRGGAHRWRRFTHRSHHDHYAYTEHRTGWRHEGYREHRTEATTALPYNYVSRSHHSYFGEYDEREQQSWGNGGEHMCCHRCHRGCEGGDGYGDGSEGYAAEGDEGIAPMSINDPAALDPWHGYNGNNGFTDW